MQGICFCIIISVFRINYCKFGNFRVTFILRVFDFRIISETLNSRTSTHAVYIANCNSLLARTLFSRCNEFANISENLVLAKITGFTVIHVCTSLETYCRLTCNTCTKFCIWTPCKKKMILKSWARCSEKYSDDNFPPTGKI